MHNRVLRHQDKYIINNLFLRHSVSWHSMINATDIIQHQEMWTTASLQWKETDSCLQAGINFQHESINLGLDVC